MHRIIKNIKKYVKECQSIETPAFLVWDQEKEEYSANKKYFRYAISRMEQKDVLEGTDGIYGIHPDDIDKYRNFVLQEREAITKLRLLTTQNKYEHVSIEKKLVEEKETNKLYTILIIRPIESAGIKTGGTETKGMDRLTGLIGQNAFEELCESQRLYDYEKNTNALAIMSIDQYGNLRRSCGAEVLDEIIVKVADAIKRELKEGMVLARYWEDCFLLCYHKAGSMEKAYEYFEQLANRVRIPYGDAETVTVSIGVARCNHHPELGYLSAFEQARKALLSAQRNGEAQVACQMEGESRNGGIMMQLPPARDIYIRTFGYFEVFLNGEVLMFRHEKSKELLALLTAHRGGYITAESAISVLWEEETVNKTTLSRYRKVVMRLMRILKEHGIEDIIFGDKRRRCLDMSKVRCDYTDYVEGKTSMAHPFDGHFMTQYSWAESFKAPLFELMGE